MNTQPSFSTSGPAAPSRSKQTKLGMIWGFLSVRKKWWLTPIIIVTLLLGALIVMTQGSAMAPFIYTLF